MLNKLSFSPNQRGGFVIVLSILVVVVFVSVGTYYLGTQQSKPEIVILTNSPVPTFDSSAPLPSNASAKPSTRPSTSLPSDWTYQKSTACNTSFPIPPKKEPYLTTTLPSTGATNDNNRFWKLSENTESELFLFKDDSSLNYAPTEEASLGNGYNPGSVSIFCTRNNETLTNGQLVSTLEAYIKSNNYDFKLLNKRNLNKWNIDVVAVNIQGGMFGEADDVYFFNIGNRSYFVTYSSQSENQVVKDTTKKIFDNLQFTD